MHTVHLAHNPEKGDVKYAAMGLFFSVDEYTREGLTLKMIKTIDKFFDQMQWDDSTTNP